MYDVTITLKKIITIILIEHFNSLNSLNLLM